MKKIVIAADSFKGSISSSRFADVCQAAINTAMPRCSVVKVPLGDGGEGTVDALIHALDGHEVSATVGDPLLRPIKASYGISADGSTAIIEMARASGLPLLDPEERNPMATSTFGTGQLIADAISRGCRRLLIGIGGSATNDAGIGMLTALGARFLDRDGRSVSAHGCGGDLARIDSIDLSGLDPRLADTSIIVACDVDNPFCGPSGAAHVFARQKGADDAMIATLDNAMQSFARVLARTTSTDVTDMPGAGAAGGLGGAFAAVLGASLMPGIDMVLQAVGFDRLIDGADLIITGEGRIDSQTLMGKTPHGVLTAARRRGIPVVALGGSVEHSAALDQAGFAAILSIQPGPVALSDALDPDKAARNLADTVTQIISIAKALSLR